MARILADEDFPRPVVLQLRALGHDVLMPSDLGIANVGTSDDAVLRCAIHEGRTILTHNRRHFRRLHRTHPDHPGIVICTHDRDWDRLMRHIQQALEAHATLTGMLLRVTRAGLARETGQ
jgi:hypothetical protein